MSHPDWNTSFRASVANTDLQSGLLAFQREWRGARDQRVAELVATTGETERSLRNRLAESRAASRAERPALIEQFEQQAVANGAEVARVGSATEACQRIATELARHGVCRVVKGKSMASEEIHLNAYLAGCGIDVIESDVGEWIVQQTHDRPSHLVLPVIHRTRGQIAAALGDLSGTVLEPDDIGAMVKHVRERVRPSFHSAGAGITGANALIASTGSVMLVSNEGNNRLASSVPPLHVIIAGIDKVVADHTAAAHQLRLLARSATGQTITSYTSFLRGPRRGQHQLIVLLDNGRTSLAADPIFAAALDCIRCGACADVCPPYQVVGGHAFGHIYTGAIGLVVSPAHHGLASIARAQELCLSCGACNAVCPADIPLAEQILAVRAEVETSLSPHRARRFLLRRYRSRRLTAVATAAAAILTAPLVTGPALRLRRPQRLLGWRALPRIPLRPARSRLHRRRASVGPARTGDVDVFLQCIADRLDPVSAIATVELLEATGATVRIPKQQHCCGLPLFDTGDIDGARRFARDLSRTFAGDRPVITPAPSCARFVREQYPPLLANDRDAAAATSLAGRIVDIVEHLGAADLGRLGPVVSRPYAVHHFCQTASAGQGQRLHGLLAAVGGATPRPLAEDGVCCGFGGTTSIHAPEVSRGVAERKLACIAATGAAELVTDNPACVLHLRGVAVAAGLQLRVSHIATFLRHCVAGSPATPEDS